jgi:two-component system, OmpR family, response regulator BaeR
MLPGRNGMDLCRDIRAFSAVPIVMLTARVEEVDRLLGLDLGADDYVCKPYSPREVMARIRAIFRRLDRRLVPVPPDEGFHVDPEQFSIRLDGKALDLTATEFRLLSRLVAQPGRVHSRDRLLDCLHEDGREITDRTVDSHIKNIRRKIAQIVPDRELVVSVYGVGYKVES